MSVGAVSSTNSIATRTILPGDDFEGWLASRNRPEAAPNRDRAQPNAQPRTLFPGDDMEAWTASMQSPAKPEGTFWGKDGFTFRDVLDTLNPLQHLPVVGSIYRSITGETVSPGARIIGGTIFGGPLGLVSSVADSMLEDVSGKSAGGHVMAALGFKDKSVPLVDEIPAAVAIASKGGASDKLNDEKIDVAELGPIEQATIVASAAPGPAAPAPITPSNNAQRPAFLSTPRINTAVSPYPMMLPPNVATKGKGPLPATATVAREGATVRRAEEYTAVELLDIFKRYQQASQLRPAGDERRQETEERL
ncbi:MAG: hypothetical protein FJX65_02155 [Alphaproteobacteria bacterium]|nr:hypothetical protein [Alphaproteobacteria bacterium]